MGATVVVGGEEAVEPTSLRYVGPATAIVIEQAEFDAVDIREARVSHRNLVEAGVNPGIAELLRREYALLWNFRWHPGGEYLPRRAAKMRGASQAERRWIAASADGFEGRLPDVAANGAGQGDPPAFEFNIDDWPDWPEVDGEHETTAGLDATFGDTDDARTECPRCEQALSTFEMGNQQSVQCTNCGYVGVQLSSHAVAWRRAVERLVRGEISTAQG